MVFQCCDSCNDKLSSISFVAQMPYFTITHGFIKKHLKRKDIWIALAIGILIGYIFTKQPKPKFEADINDYKKLNWAVEQIQNEYQVDNSSIAAKLFNEIRVLCWVIISPWNHHRKARHVKNTWGRRCNRILFFSTIRDKELDTIILPTEEGYRYLWGKTKFAIEYIHENFLHEADWFLKADDDTYVILENLRFLLTFYSANISMVIGSELNEHENENEKYLNGGAGYVLSKRALQQLTQNGLQNKRICRQGIRGSEDIEIAKCLKKLNVPIANSLDFRRRQSFMPFGLEKHLVPGNMDHDWSKRFVSKFEGLDCCSDFPITFHSLSSNQMYIYEFFIYRLKVYGIDLNKNNKTFIHYFNKSFKIMPDEF